MRYLSKYHQWLTKTVNGTMFKRIIYFLHVKLWLVSTGIVMGVVNKIFTDTNNIGANIGSNLGSRSISIIDKDKAIKMLKKQGITLK